MLIDCVWQHHLDSQRFCKAPQPYCGMMALMNVMQTEENTVQLLCMRRAKRLRRLQGLAHTPCMEKRMAGRAFKMLRMLLPPELSFRYNFRQKTLMEFTLWEPQGHIYGWSVLACQALLSCNATLGMCTQRTSILS